jgi:hypothetical protein
MISRRFPRTVIALFCLGLFVAPQGAQGQTQVLKLKIGTLGAPSTSVWMVSVLVAKRFDLKNGIDIEWVEQPTAGEKERRLLDAGHQFRHGSAGAILDTDRDSLVSRHGNPHLRFDVGGLFPGLRTQHSRCGQSCVA